CPGQGRRAAAPHPVLGGQLRRQPELGRADPGAGTRGRHRDRAGHRGLRAAPDIARQRRDRPHLGQPQPRRRRHPAHPVRLRRRRRQPAGRRRAQRAARAAAGADGRGAAGGRRRGCRADPRGGPLHPRVGADDGARAAARRPGPGARGGLQAADAGRHLGGGGLMARRHLATVTGASGGPGVYARAVDPASHTLADAVRVARLAEEARIDALFTPDLLRFNAQGAIGAQDSLVTMAALALVTSRIGLVTTVTTTFNHPFTLARQLGTLDHVSNGRSAWNLVTSSVGEENYGGELPSPEDRYARAAETLEVTNALWDSWAPGALTAGAPGEPARLDPSLVHPIDHHGRFFDVAGPLNVPPLPQRRPVQIVAAQSAAGIELAARHAEVVFTALPTLDVALDVVGRLRGRAR